ncbi:MAG: RNA-binding protein [Alphaproteobacteria bacterium]|nr:RNA-binding protein [Alphaproteobacteria bacterium]
MTEAAVDIDDTDEMAGAGRRCLVTGEVRPRETLIRFVVAPDPKLGVVPDIAGTLPGRGFWVTATREAIAAAMSRHLFARAARGPVAVDPTLPDLVESLLVRRLIDWIALARRAGCAITGFEKARIAMNAGRLKLLVDAVDAAAGGVEKLSGPGVRRIAVLTRDELGQAFSRPEATHVAITDSTWADRLIGEAKRLAGFRPHHETI